ncbi:MAG: sugar ABC transporter permease [Spirochaetia bacterium]
MREQKYTPYLFISPFFLLFTLFSVGPLVYALYMSFNRIESFAQAPEFVGLRQYINILTDPRFHRSLLNIFTYTVVAVSFTLAISLLLANLLNVRLPGRVVYRSAYFLPVVTSLVAAGIFFRLILAERVGILNEILRSFGLPSYRWLNDPKLMMPSLIVVTTWRSFGFFLVIFLAAIQNIPSELYDASRVDGASITQTLFRITLPLLFPTIFFCIVTATIGSIQLFDEPYVLFTAQGGVPPRDEVITPAIYLYNSAFQQFRFGKAAAVGFIVSLIIFILTLAQVRIMGRRGGFST